MNWTLRTCAAACIAAAVLATPGSAGGATVDVTVGGVGFIFTPQDITINVNDTVRWTWAGGFHDVESGVGGVHDGNFDSGAPTTAMGTTFEVVFDAAFLAANPMAGNLYPYYCTPHVEFDMIGSVTVAVCAEDCGTFDGQIDVSDLLSLLAQWGGPGSCDVNTSGTVDVADLLDLLAKWGGCV